jgi:hypothetical protein
MKTAQEMYQNSLTLLTEHEKLQKELEETKQEQLKIKELYKEFCELIEPILLKNKNFQQYVLISDGNVDFDFSDTHNFYEYYLDEYPHLQSKVISIIVETFSFLGYDVAVLDESPWSTYESDNYTMLKISWENSK